MMTIQTGYVPNPGPRGPRETNNFIGVAYALRDRNYIQLPSLFHPLSSCVDEPLRKRGLVKFFIFRLLKSRERCDDV